MLTLDPNACYRALQAHDARFDGTFVVGVKTTGVYCRPICRARTPRADRCEFFRFGVQAEREGYRACFRCRPELAPPRVASVDATEHLLDAITTRIEAGALDEGSAEQLAKDLGITTRHLRRIVQAELGVTPIELAQSRRLALAKALLHDTTLSIAEVAFASGFSSVRRFNTLFRERMGVPPTSLRRTRARESSESVMLTLGYRAPYAWLETLAFFAARAIPGVERVENGVYRRTVRMGTRSGWLSVTHVAEKSALRVEMSLSLVRALLPIAARVRDMFDLRADPRAIDAHLERDRTLRASVRRTPGLRVPGAFDGFELVVRAILGQQVSVAAATTFAGRIAARFGEAIATPHEGLAFLFPTPARMAKAKDSELTALGITSARARSIRALAEGVLAGRIAFEQRARRDEVTATLLELPGIGPWTTSYVAMRALREADAFPEGDLALRNASGLTAVELATRAEAWRPWRAYAALHLWASLRQTRRVSVSE